jgi:carboxylate-amine ligase
VAVPGAERTLAVYNALRSYLPELAALAANAPLHAGEDAGMASVRPKIAEQLPRQGVPPAISSWAAFAEELDWGARSGWLSEPGVWWWEARPHLRHGTIELRVPDAQTSVREAAGVVAFAHALVAWLADRADAGDLPAPAPTWRIEENRWAAARHGLDGTLADLVTGARTPVRERLAALLEDLAPVAARLGGAAELEAARELVSENGAIRQRRVAVEHGVEGVAEWLAERYAEGLSVPASVGNRAGGGTGTPW